MATQIEGDAPLWLILTGLQEELRKLKFSAMPDDDVTAIRPEAIVIRKLMRTPTDENVGEVDEELPGLIISHNKSVSAEEDGQNCDDDTRHELIVQVVDKDYGNREKGMRTYFKWENMIQRRVNGMEWLDHVPIAVAGVYYAHTRRVDNLQQSEWLRHRLFRGGVSIVVKSREERTEDD